MKIVNLTQHLATPEQKEAGVVDFEKNTAEKVKQLLTFETIPTQTELVDRANQLVIFAEISGADAALIGGAPFFMSTLEKELKREGIKPLYAFSRRESVEKTLPDGSIQKTNIFKHIGFVEV